MKVILKKCCNVSLFFLLFLQTAFVLADYNSCMMEATQKCNYAMNSNGYVDSNTCMQWESAFCDEEAYEVVVTGSSNSGGGAYTSGGGASGQIDREEHTPQDREQEKQKCKQNNVVNNQLCKSNARDAFTSDMKECDYWMNTALAISGGSITGYRRIGIGPAGLAQAFAGVVAAKASTCQTSTAAKRDQFLQTCESIKLNNDSACDKL